MPSIREVNTCERCRQLKRRCDRVKPTCSRCLQQGLVCSFDVPNSLDGSDSELQTFALFSESSPSIELQDDILHSPQLGQCDLAIRANTSRAVRKRNRACLSCIRCHRNKVRCDKKLPCTRCDASGFKDQCTYTHRATNLNASQDASLPFGSVKEDPTDVLVTWHSRHRGSSHWKPLLSRVGDNPRQQDGDYARAYYFIGRNFGEYLLGTLYTCSS
jgi:hypothetical protein